MFLFWPSLILAVYVVCSGVLPLKIHWFWKLLSAAVIFLISMKYMAYTMNGGTFFEPAVKGAWMLAWEALYGALILAAFLLLLKDICSLGLWLLGAFGVKTGFSFNRLVFIVPIFIVSVAGGFWGMCEGIKVPEVKTETIVFKNLPVQWKGTTIALLSDLHVGPVQRKEWLSEIVKRTNDLNPDIVMITGDFIDGRVQKLLPELEPLKHLKSKYGVYAVPGNHEYYSVYREWMAALPTLGIKVLRNGSDVLTKEGASLVVGGTTDLGASRFGEESPNVEKTFSGTSPEDFRILLAHQPKTGSLSKEKFDLQLSGHTHGGHIFFMYPILAYFNDGLVSGFYDRGDRKVYVTNGSGLWNGFTMRVSVPSEITFITLQ